MADRKIDRVAGIIGIAMSLVCLATAWGALWWADRKDSVVVDAIALLAIIFWGLLAVISMTAGYGHLTGHTIYSETKQPHKDK